MNDMPNCGPAVEGMGEPDPIFAVIERHRTALRGWVTAYDRLGVLQEMIPEARRHWQIFDERPDDCADAPEWIDANITFLAAIEELAKALEVVLSTPPTTTIGVANLLDYVGGYECQPLAPILVNALSGNNYGPISKGTYEAVRKAAANFLPMVAATLSQRTTREPDPIFAAIERHRTALRGWSVAMVQRWRLSQTIPETRRRWESGQKPRHCPDAPEWIEANTTIIETYEELDKALESVLSSPPTTIAGVADLLNYISREEWEVAGAIEYGDGEWSGTIFENALDGSHDQGLVENPTSIVEGVTKAAANFLPMVAATLRSLKKKS